MAQNWRRERTACSKASTVIAPSYIVFLENIQWKCFCLQRSVRQIGCAVQYCWESWNACTNVDTILASTQCAITFKLSGLWKLCVLRIALLLKDEFLADVTTLSSSCASLFTLFCLQSSDVASSMAVNWKRYHGKKLTLNTLCKYREDISRLCRGMKFSSQRWKYFSALKEN